MTHDMRDALEPCPFCGARPFIGEGGEPEHATIACNNDACIVDTCCVSSTKDEAVKRWNTRALTASPGEQKPFGWLGRDGKFSLPVEMTRERFLSHFHDNDPPVGTPVIPLYTSAPGEQEPCGWQFCCPDGKWIGCDEPPANELRDEPEKFRRVYLSPPPAAGWNEAQINADAEYLDALESELIAKDLDMQLERRELSPSIIADHLREALSADEDKGKESEGGVDRKHRNMLSTTEQQPEQRSGPSDTFINGIEAAAAWHEKEAAHAKAIYSEMDRYSDDSEEMRGWRSYKDKEDRHLYCAAVIRGLPRPSDPTPPDATAQREAIARIKNRIDSHLNDYLCDMKPGYDDSISGFNDAWDIVRKLFDEAILALRGGE